MTDPTAAPNAYSLLTKPTLELTDAEVALIVADLRKRRLAYIGDKPVQDRPDKAPKPAAKQTAADKAALTKALAANLNLDLDL